MVLIPLALIGVMPGPILPQAVRCCLDDRYGRPGRQSRTYFIALVLGILVFVALTVMPMMHRAGRDGRVQAGLSGGGLPASFVDQFDQYFYLRN